MHETNESESLYSHLRLVRVTTLFILLPRDGGGEVVPFSVKSS